MYTELEEYREDRMYRSTTWLLYKNANIEDCILSERTY